MRSSTVPWTGKPIRHRPSGSMPDAGSRRGDAPPRQSGASAHGRSWGGKDMNGSVAVETADIDYQGARPRLRAVAGPGRAAPGAAPGRGGRRRARRALGGDRPRAAGRARRPARRRQPPLHRLARHLLRQAHPGDLRPPRLRPAHGRQGRHLEPRQGLLPRRAGLRLQPPARGRPPAPRLHQPPAILRRRLPVRAGARAAQPRHPLEAPGHRARADGGRRFADRRHARRASTGSAAIGWWRPTARAARSARPWGWKARAAPSATAS